MNKVKPILNEADYKKYLRALESYGYKYVALFKIGVDTGLRVSDLRLLKYRDVLGQGSIKIKEQKTKKCKKICIDKKLKDFLRLNFKYYGFTLDDYICSHPDRKRPISRVQIYRVMKRAGEDVGLHGYGTHSMRKTYAINLFKETGDIKLVQEKLNHKYRDTTLVSYILSGLDFENLRDYF